MTPEEISKIKEHIEIHARNEFPHAIKITEILLKAVDELEHIAELEKENAELSKQLLAVSEQLRFAKDMPYSAVKKFAEERTQEQLTKAKKLIKNIIHVTWGEGWNYSLGWKVKAEQFLKENES